jgi:hypothetical protein
MNLTFIRPWAAAAGIVVSCLMVMPVSAQNFNGDARSIGLQTAGGQTNFASELTTDARPYRSIVLPLGLYQVFKNTDIFDPGKSTFDPIRVMELAANPLHYTFNRNEGDTGEQLVRDLVNGQISRDLNTYRGFIPARNIDALGLLNPSFGKTFKVHKADDGSFQGFYVGAGPYVALGTNFAADPTLVGLLSSSTNQYLPNSTLTLRDNTGMQAAGAVTVGYRAHFSLPGQSGRSKRDGVYVAVNYNYLRGIHYESVNLGVTFNTDSTGLITLQPTTVPIVVDRLTSSHGQGDAVDIGTHVIMGHWNFRGSANGIANHIDWSGLRAENYTLSSLLQSLSFVKTSAPAPAGDLRVTLPVRYAGGAGYDASRWSVDSEIGRGLQGNEFRGGAEYRLLAGHVAFRGGTRYSRQQWNPGGGIGFNITRSFGVDVAAYGTSTNIEELRKVALAMSLRFDRRTETN